MKAFRLTPLLISCGLAIAPVWAKPISPSTDSNSKSTPANPTLTNSNSTKSSSTKSTSTNSNSTKSTPTNPTSTNSNSTNSNPTNPATTIPTSSSSSFERGVDQLQNYRPDQAIISFSRALLAAKSGSKNFRATVFLMIGRAFQADENDLAAVQAMTIAHELAPNDQTITAYLADGLVRSGQRDKANKYFKWLKEQKEKQLATLEMLALEAIRTSDPEKAKEYLTTALKMPGAKKDTHLLLLYARLLAKTGLSTQAGEVFKQAADATTNQYLKNMAEATVQRLAGKPKKQIEFLKAAGEILPGEPNWHVELGECYTSEGNKRAALDQFNLAMSGRLSTRAFLRTAIFTRSEKRYQDALKAALLLEQVETMGL